MIWIIGNTGLLGMELEAMLRKLRAPLLLSNSSTDITSLSTLREFSKDHKIDVIINCAAYTDVVNAENNAEKAFNINALGAENVATIAKEKDAILIHISTDYVFEGSSLNSYAEGDTCKPMTIYGKSKLEGETRVRNAWNKHFIIRTSWLYGKYKNNFVFTMLNLFSKKAQINIVDDQTGSPTYAFDLAEGILNILSQESQAYGTYHFSNRNKTDWYEFAQQILTLSIDKKILPTTIFSGLKLLPITSAEDNSTVSRPANSYLDCTLFESVFNYKIKPWKISLNEFLEIVARSR